MKEYQFELKGDYCFGKFLSHQNSSNNEDEVIQKICPADLSNNLWQAKIYYSNIEKILESASNGFKKWKNQALNERIDCLISYQSQIKKRKDELCRAISFETGKPLWEAETEVQAVINKVEITISDSLPRIKEQIFSEIMPATEGHLYYKPIGPSLIIGPFNFPCHLANGQIISALISGNSIIFKPSEKTIYSAQILIECFHAANFPEGVINFINGSGEVVQRLLRASEIKAIFFTGSREVGKRILATTHQDLTKIVALELGGKNTSIVHHDALWEPTLDELLKACFLTSGQRCTSTSIVAIHEKLADRFIEEFHQRAKKLIIDHPIHFEQRPFMGPLIDQKAVDNYLLYMGMAKREGYDEIMRGKLLDDRKFSGYYVSPSIHYSKIVKNKGLFFLSEIFGPSCTFYPYKEIEEAIEITNLGEYGLAGAVFTQDRNIYKNCVQNIDVGLFNWNRSTVGSSSKLPFGGIKNSGNYRPAGVSMIDATVFPMACLEQKIS